MLAVVDQNGQEVGIAYDPNNGLLLRRVGSDAIVFFATMNGPVTGSLIFYHSAPNCSDNRYLPIMGGAGFAYSAIVRGGTAFYTKTMDPNRLVQVPIHAFEAFGPSDDATQPGECTQYDGGTGSLGVLTMTSDPVLASLVLPLRLK